MRFAVVVLDLEGRVKGLIGPFHTQEGANQYIAERNGANERYQGQVFRIWRPAKLTSVVRQLERSIALRREARS